jgi:hypothetical protein
MERLANFREMINKLLDKHLGYGDSRAGVETFAIRDERGGNYLLMNIGWQRSRRVNGIVFHLRIKGNKIWVEQDWTEHGVANELIELGIPPEDIELGFQPPEMRPYTELAEMVATRKALRERNDPVEDNKQ